MTSRRKIKDCLDETSSLQRQSCIQKFISSKIDCKTPWEGIFSNASRNCSSNEDLKKYFDLRLDIYRGRYKEELSSCLKPNCFENHWKQKSLAKLPRNSILYELGGEYEPNIQIYQFTTSSDRVRT